jgi:hypothetical protein
VLVPGALITSRLIFFMHYYIFLVLIIVILSFMIGRRFEGLKKNLFRLLNNDFRVRRTPSKCYIAQSL